MTKRSQYHYVCWHKPSRRWLVKFHVRGHGSGHSTINVMYFPPEEEEVAAHVADVAARLILGPDAQQNLDGLAPPSVPEGLILNELLEKPGMKPEHLFLG